MTARKRHLPGMATPRPGTLVTIRARSGEHPVAIRAVVTDRGPDWVTVAGWRQAWKLSLYTVERA